MLKVEEVNENKEKDKVDSVAAETATASKDGKMPPLIVEG